MDHQDNRKKEPWRVIVFLLSILFIAGMWVKKDILSVYTGMPREQVAPLIATTAAVSLLKVAAIAGGILLLKWLLKKTKRK